MSTARERHLASISTSADGHAVKLSQAEEVQAIVKETGVELSGIKKVKPGDLRTVDSNSTAFSLMSDDKLQRLADDIKANGIVIPLLARDPNETFTAGVLIDGHNRLAAAKLAKVEKVPVQFVEGKLSPEAEAGLVFKLNYLRRHLDENAEAKAAQRLANLFPDLFGGNVDTVSTSDNESSNVDTVSTSGYGTGKGGKAKVAKVTGMHPKKIQRLAKVASTAKQLAKADGLNKPADKHFEKAAQTLKAKRKTPSDRTGKAQSSAASQGKGKGRGENEKALRAFASGLNNSLRGVELENAQTLKAAVGIAKAWLKDVERKARSAKG